MLLPKAANNNDGLELVWRHQLTFSALAESSLIKIESIKFLLEILFSCNSSIVHALRSSVQGQMIGFGMNSPNDIFKSPYAKFQIIFPPYK